MTNKQKDIIKAIESKLGIVYEGKNIRDHASTFIGKHLNKLREFNYENAIPHYATANQLRLIRAIERGSNKKFKGKTYDQARRFIKKYSHLAEYKKPSRILF